MKYNKCWECSEDANIKAYFYNNHKMLHHAVYFCNDKHLENFKNRNTDLTLTHKTSASLNV